MVLGEDREEEEENDEECEDEEEEEVVEMDGEVDKELFVPEDEDVEDSIPKTERKK